MDLTEIGSSNDSEAKLQDPSGIWLGTQTIVGTDVFDMKTIIHNGMIYGISEDAGVAYAGTYKMTEGVYMVSDGRENSSTSYRLYDLYDNNNKFAIGLVSASVKEHDKFSGTFQNSTYQEGELFSYYSALYEYSVSLSDIAGEHISDYMDVTISDNGTVSGTFKGCGIDGNVYVSEKGKNIFDIILNTTECDNAGTYEGLGIIMLDDDDTPYFIGLTANDTRMEGIRFALDSAPASFAAAAASSGASEQSRAAETAQARRNTMGTTTGETHDNENFDNVRLVTNFLDSSYKNASFNNAVIGGGGFEETTINSSNFSGSSFGGTYFGGLIGDGYNKVVVNTFIDDSDFSNSTFYKGGSSRDRLFISPADTDFSGSSFEDLDLFIDRDGNDFSNSRLSALSIDITGSNNNFKDSAFDGYEMVSYNSGWHVDYREKANSIDIHSNADFSGSTLTNLSYLTLYHDTNMDFSDVTVSGLQQLTLYAKADFSNANLSGALIEFHSNIFNPENPDEVIDDKNYDSLQDFLKDVGNYYFFDTHDILSFYIGGSFSGANLSDSYIWISRKLNEVENDQNYGNLVLMDVNFHKADLSRAKILDNNDDSFQNNQIVTHPIFLGCDFTGVNLSDADLENGYFILSDMSYANLEGATKPSAAIGMRTADYSNAWWYDGSRCASTSVGLCIPSPFNTGLSYEEYLAGKTELQKFEENAKKAAEEAAQKAKKFIEKPANTVIRAVCGLFGC